MLGSVIVGLLCKQKLDETSSEVKAVQELSKLAGILEKQKDNSESTFDYNEAFRMSALSVNINEHSFKQVLVFAGKSEAYQQLKKLKEAEQEINKSQENLSVADKKALDSSQGLEIQVSFYKAQGSLLAKNKETQKAIESYTTGI